MRKRLEVELPLGWTKAFDARTRRHYYWNINTNETSWSVPSSPGVGVGSDGKQSREERGRVCSEQYEFWGDQTSSNGSLSSSGSTVGSRDDVLLEKERKEREKFRLKERLFNIDSRPLGEDIDGPSIGQSENPRFVNNNNERWCRVVDPASKRVYFWDPKTNETRWSIDELPVIMEGLSTEDQEFENEEDVNLEGKLYRREWKRRENVVAESSSYTPRTAAQRRKTLVPKPPEIRQILEKILREHYLFQSLSTEERFEVVDVMAKQELEPGENAVVQGDKGDYFYVVDQGSFDVLRMQDGEEPKEDKKPKQKNKAKVVGKIEAKGCFGELALLYEKKRAATVRASTPAVVWTLDRKTFRSILQSSSKHDIESAMKVLRKVPLLKALTDDQVRKCAEAVRFVEFKTGDQIIRKGDIGDVFYIIKHGKVFCSEGESISDKTSGTIELGEHDYFGERALLKEEPRAANVMALTDVSLMALDRHAFTTLLGPLREVLDHNIRTSVLREIPLFRCLNKEELEQIFSAFTMREYRRGDHIIRQGSHGSTLYVLRSGQADVFQDVPIPEDVDIGKATINENGTVTQYVHTLKMGDYFGEMALVHGTPRNAHVVATEHCQCFCLDRKSFETLLGPARDILDRDISRRRRDNMLKRNEIPGQLERGDSMDLAEILEAMRQDGDSEVDGEDDEGESDDDNNEHGPRETGDDTCVDESIIGADKQLQEIANSNEDKPRIEPLATMKLGATARYFPSLEKPGESRHQQLGPRVAKPPIQGNDNRTQGVREVEEELEPHAERRCRTNFDLSHFDGVRTLGTGTFGRVKLVRHRSNGQAYALKIQSKAQIVKFKLQQNVLNEKYVMQLLDHPFIITLHQTFQDRDCLYMLLELVQGGELFSLLQTHGQALTAEHHRFYTACVVSAFEAMHAHKILYRDLKPENLLIDSMGYLKVVDFGFAKIVRHLTYTLCGTPEYFSPELVLGKGYSRPNDCWAIGILTYEIINGYTPFGGPEDNQNEICKRVVKECLRFPNDCHDSQAKDFISRLLNKNPVQRLGGGKFGISALKKHPWFASLDWLALENKQIRSPWTPQLDHPFDTKHFDSYDENYSITPFNVAPGHDPFLTHF